MFHSQVMLSELQKLCYDDHIAKVNEILPIPSFTINDDWSEKIYQDLKCSAQDGETDFELLILEHTNGKEKLGGYLDILPNEFVQWWNSTNDSDISEFVSLTCCHLLYELIACRRVRIVEKYIEAMKDHWVTKSDVKVEIKFGVRDSKDLKWIMIFSWIDPQKEKALESARKKIKL